MKLLFTLVFCIGLSASVYAQQASNGLFALPTAYTLPKGTHSMSSYELVFLQYSYSVTNSTHISAFSMFPFTADAFTSSFAIGVKQQLYKNDAFAFAGTGSFLPESKTFLVMGIASLGSPNNAVHLGVGTGGQINVDQENGLQVMVGGNKEVSEKISLLAEFLTSTEAIDTEFKGLFSIGGRYRTTDGLTVDFGVMRPVTTVDLGGFLMFPILKATYEF